jgi:translation initiation factor 3 subunit C
MRFLALCYKIEGFYKKYNDQINIARIYLLIILHTYYKTEDNIKKVLDKVDLSEYTNLRKSYEKPEEFIAQLCSVIYVHSDEKTKLRALLSNIYFLCIHNKYDLARRIFKQSYIYEYIQVYKDYQLKMIFNRTLAQLGLCAFRFGNYSECLSYLYPLCANGTTKLKEYLSQLYSKDIEKTLDKEERKKMIPYIMTINIDEIESSYYISSMFLNLPDILLSKLGLQSKPFNLAFKKNLDNFNKQVLKFIILDI